MPAALAAQDVDDVETTSELIAPSIYMLQGSGGNIVVSIGDDGVLVVDDQYAPLIERIAAAIGALSDAPVEYVVNTHFHYDHTGGNENFGQLGAEIVAHEQNRTRMLNDQLVGTTPPACLRPRGAPGDHLRPVGPLPL